MIPDRAQSPRLIRNLHCLAKLIDAGIQQTCVDIVGEASLRSQPVLSAIAAGASTVTEISRATHLSQAAVSQTVKELEYVRSVQKRPVKDGRSMQIELTDKGRTLHARFDLYTKSVAAALDSLENEIGFPIRRQIDAAVEALKRRRSTGCASDDTIG